MLDRVYRIIEAGEPKLPEKAKKEGEGEDEDEDDDDDDEDDG